MLIAALGCGFLLDLLLGDPKWLPHPVVFLGKLIGYLERQVRHFAGDDSSNLLFGGFFLVIVVCFLSYGIPYVILTLAGHYSYYWVFAFTVLLSFQILATRSLAKAAQEVKKALEQTEDLTLARTKLSYIVGRDTQELTREEIIKATIETVAENTSDGVIAPLFYLFLGGIPLGLLYKAINTMDSMLGYRTEKFLYLGRAAAKLDDAANFIPSRFTALLLLVAATLLHLDAANGWRIFRRDRFKHLSPNSAQTEAVVAGILHVQLGGGHYYFGEFVAKATIGNKDREPVVADITTTNRLLYATAWLGFLLCGCIRYLAF